MRLSPDLTERVAVYVTDLTRCRKYVLDEYDHYTHKLLLLMQKAGRKSITVNGYTLKIAPAKPTHLSPSQRRKVREHFPTAILNPANYPPRVVIEKVRGAA